MMTRFASPSLRSTLLAMWNDYPNSDVNTELDPMSNRAATDENIHVEYGMYLLSETETTVDID
jgi:hypothetical protein